MIFGTVVVLLLLSVLYFFTNKGYEWVYIIYKTFWRDLRAAVRFIRLNIVLKQYLRNNITVPKLFTQNVDKHPTKVAFYFEDEIWTFEALESYSNQVAHYFKNKGFIRGQVVALFLENKPEYVGIWLGLAKIGVISSLINTNLVSLQLLHSLKICQAKAVIFDNHFRNVMKEISNEISGMVLYEFGVDQEEQQLKDSFNFCKQLENQPKTRLSSEIAMGKSTDKILFIYTSGTTGLPKAAVITNMRSIFMGLGFYYMTCLNEKDVWYDPLPLYHSAGGIVGVTQSLLCGIPVVIRKKFSASNYWNDCIKYNCTVAQYIGEICRFILAAHSKNDQIIKHSVTKMIGNGLRPQIWQKFVDRFGVKQIFEFYGSTEGNSNLINIDNKVGSIGFVPRYAKLMYPVTLIRCNEFTGEPIRNQNGFCMHCDPGEVGVFVGIVKDKNSINSFQGYSNKKENEKKLINNVFVKGDVYFNSGDILIQDELGYYYFKDRTGDTFRWKGENVATAEIEAIISNFAGLTDATVYGVEIPGNEGRAGMLSIVDLQNLLKLDDLAKKLKANLPSYAIPIFVRVLKSIPMTGTYKLKKTDLQSEGYNIEQVADDIFVFDAKTVTYNKLTQEKFNEIQSGKIRI